VTNEKIFTKEITDMAKDVYLGRNKKISNEQVRCIEHFSNGENKCQCCGEDNILFLTLSHVNGDGWIHRSMHTGSMAKCLIKNNFETQFNIKIECYNCNLARERNNGVCPHNG